MVVHQAAQASVRESVEEVAKVSRYNVDGIIVDAKQPGRG
jgi:nucleoside-diphosphate-sugar epimerase